MEDYIIQRQFYIVFAALSLGILGLLLGGFGNPILDRILHIIMFFAVSFIIFYYVRQDKKQNFLKIISLTLFTLIYSAMINPLLGLFGLLPLCIIIFWTKKENKITPVIDKDSPLAFGFNHMPKWKILLVFLYCVSVFLVREI